MLPFRVLDLPGATRAVAAATLRATLLSVTLLASVMMAGMVSGASRSLADDAPAASESPPDEVGPEVAGFKTLYRFQAGVRGRFPRGGVVHDAAGNIYGTTLYEGACSTCGIIYMLRKPTTANGAWTQHVVHQFSFPQGTNLQDGRAPTAPLTFYAGKIYGTTSAGADPSCGCGEVFRITPNAGATAWTYTVLYRFRRNLPSSPVNGSTPIGGVIVDSSGIYGTTSSGGSANRIGAGVIYKLPLNGGAITILHRFPTNLGPNLPPGDNGGPQGELVFGKDGAIYGSQYGGGKYNQGKIFRITKAGALRVLYDFKGVNQPGNSTDGAQPEGRIAVGPDGTLYGTTTFGGTPSGYGTAWSLKPPANPASGVWAYKQLRRFGMTGDANLPHSGFVRAANGMLYGTGAGGGHFQEGAIYSLKPPATANGAWTYKTLYSFNGPVTPSNGNGHIPYGVIVLKANTLWGQNLSGGKVTIGQPCGSGCGTVWQFGL